MFSIQTLIQFSGFKCKKRTGSRRTPSFTSVADPDPGSGAFLTPGSGIDCFRISDPGSRIPDPWSLTHTHILQSLVTFLGKNATQFYVNWPRLFIYQFNNKIIFNFVIFVATKKVGQKLFPPSLLLLLFDLWSGIRDPGSGMIKIRIRD